MILYSTRRFNPMAKSGAAQKDIHSFWKSAPMIVGYAMAKMMTKDAVVESQVRITLKTTSTIADLSVKTISVDSTSAMIAYFEVIQLRLSENVLILTLLSMKEEDTPTQSVCAAC